MFKKENMLTLNKLIKRHFDLPFSKVLNLEFRMCMYQETNLKYSVKINFNKQINNLYYHIDVKYVVCY